jgi:hypothetical protein
MAAVSVVDYASVTGTVTGPIAVIGDPLHLRSLGEMVRPDAGARYPK